MNAEQDPEDRAAELRAKVRAEAPQVLPFIRELHGAGLIRGWRDVVSLNEPKSTAGWVQPCLYLPPRKPPIKDR